MLKRTFDKILIANRGEIACRIMKTCTKLGVKSVAVFSEADANSLFVSLADEAICIGQPPSHLSYLMQDRIIAAGLKLGAQAIHPGYGFLSENSDFAAAVSTAGMEFIGPPAQAIIDMGSKSASKKIMQAAGVPVVPGYHGEDQNIDLLKAECRKIGYPVLIKAVKGGGGKGMRIVLNEDEFESMLESAQREALKSFGCDKVLVEKYILKPRHVELQVFADKLGNVVHLFERDCSVQRRHQKILEEAPAPFLSKEVRQSLGEKAVAAAKAVNYVGAGTVEFIFDTETDKFYFMEMNTRLQVEHPVTEMITGTDLVDWQLQVAAGHRLPKLQHELSPIGHAFEARIYAENPSNNFMPDTGKLVHLRTPLPSDKVRIETGVVKGDTVSVFYDPMIAKLVAHADNRNDAIKAMQNALKDFEVAGLHTNIKFLKDVIGHREFIDGELDTNFIERNKADLFPPASPLPDSTFVYASLFMHLNSQDSIQRKSSSPWDSIPGFRVASPPSFDYTFQDPNVKEPTFVKVLPTSSDSFNVVVGSQTHSIVVSKFDHSEQFVIVHNGLLIRPRVIQDSDTLHIFVNGTHSQLKLPVPSYLHSTEENADDSVKAPMPSRVVHVHVKVGDTVKKGQALIVLEAMKMEHVVKAPKAGVIAKLFFKTGDLAPQGRKLVDFVHE